MVPTKSLDYVNIITAMLYDVQTLHSDVFTEKARRLTSKKLEARSSAEGIGFLTKSLPRLGKAFDKALADHQPLNSKEHGFKTMSPKSVLPKLFGELFEQVLDHHGVVLPHADVQCIRTLRTILYSMYKLELKSSTKQEAAVIQKFVRTDEELATIDRALSSIANSVHNTGLLRATRDLKSPYWFGQTIRQARRLLTRVFSDFDVHNIYPKHGPGAVSTKERLWNKYSWSVVPTRITDTYPLDQYYYCSHGHCCDHLKEILSLRSDENLAQVILVPKDSRGPRLISCEPLEFQWIQQGLGRAIAHHVERNHLTKWSVRFTDQRPNQLGALLGSQAGKYSTLDLNEASDRVSVGLVSLLFPEPLKGALMATRSLGTKLPDQQEIMLHKFAPMGSALCFPVLALTVWSLLVAGLRAFDADILEEDVYVYGDDVIVPAQWAEHAMIILESFGLKINRDKSCTKGFFRESCGLDAYKGTDVTPVRFRTPWSSLRRPEVYTSWISYANSLHRRKFYRAYNLIVDRLIAVYDRIPDEACRISAPSLTVVPDLSSVPKRRWNKNLQKFEYHVFDSVPTERNKEIDGWKMLLRYFSEANSSTNLHRSRTADAMHTESLKTPFSVRGYTLRKRNKLRRRWR